MVLMRMLSFRPVDQFESSPVALEPAVAGSETFNRTPKDNTAVTPAARVVETEMDAPHGVSHPSGSVRARSWPRLMEALKLKGIAFELASNCSLKSLSDDEVCLLLGARHAEIRTGNAEMRLRQALRDHLGRDVRLRIEIAEHVDETPAQMASRNQEERQRAAVAAIQADATVQAFEQYFDAEVIPGSINPLTE
jgi:DNA polymerase-3 subunit gamma/tau